MSETFFVCVACSVELVSERDVSLSEGGIFLVYLCGSIEDGAIVGVVASVNGESREFRAPSTVIATGGYGHNEAWLKEFNFTNVATSTPASATGSGYDFARKAGAVFTGMDFCTAYGGAIPVTGFTKSLAANLYTNPGPIWVGLNGERFTDETKADSKVRSDAWTAAKENKVFVVYTEDVINPEMPMITGAQDPAAKLAELVEEGKYVFKADTVAELAIQAQTPWRERTGCPRPERRVLPPL